MDDKEYGKLITDAFKGDNPPDNDDVYTYKVNEYIIRALDPLEYVYLLLKGSVSVIVTANNGGMIVADTLDAPQLLGLSELMTYGDVCEADVVARNRCKVVKIPCETFQRLLEEDKNIYPVIATYLAELARRNMYYAQDRTLFNNRERFGLFLYDRASVSPLPCTIKETREQLSLLVHLNMRTLYRYIEEFNKNGYLTLSEHKITIDKDNYDKLDEDFGTLR